jgi:uncharacterized protein YdeI (YjbR/CyaY-like superfamily)
MIRKELSTLTVSSRQQWRTWLRKHHAASRGVWLVFYKGRAVARSISYEDSVREALCFGWIDSLIKRIDDGRYARKFTPRHPTSNWSDSNRKRWLQLKEARLLAAAGLAAAPTDMVCAPRRAIPNLPAYLAEALKANPKAWNFFQQLAPSYRRHFVAWIHVAKRPETRAKRILESIVLLSTGKKLGLK